MSPVMFPPSTLASFGRLIPRLNVQQIRSFGTEKIALTPDDVEDRFPPVHPDRLDRWSRLNVAMDSSEERMKRFTSVNSSALEEIFRPVRMSDEEICKRITKAPDEVFQAVVTAVNQMVSHTGVSPADMVEIEKGRLLMRIVEETASPLSSVVRINEHWSLSGDRLFCEGRGDVVLTDRRSGAATVVIAQVPGKRDKCLHDVAYRSLLGAEVLADRHGLSTVFAVGTNLFFWVFMKNGDGRVEKMRDCLVIPRVSGSSAWLVDESSLRPVVDQLYTFMLTPTDFYKPPEQH